jgi:hypothetical protein
MSRNDFDIMEFDDEEQVLKRGSQRFTVRQADQPKRSPIRRKDRWRQEAGTRSKTKKSDKKIQQRLKYSWQGE